MRYWEGEPARPATGGLPFAEHRTMAEVAAEELRREQLTQRFHDNLRKKDAEILVTEP